MQLLMEVILLFLALCKRCRLQLKSELESTKELESILPSSCCHYNVHVPSPSEQKDVIESPGHYEVRRQKIVSTSWFAALCKLMYCVHMT
jgi:hypothetical protein